MSHAYTGQGGRLTFASGQSIDVASWLADVDPDSSWSGELTLNDFFGAIPLELAMAALSDQDGGTSLLEGEIILTSAAPSSGQSGMLSRCRFKGTGAVKIHR